MPSGPQGETGRRPTRTERMSDETAARATGNVIGRVVDADEIAYVVAYVVAFLASLRTVAITGDAIACGGGVRGPIFY